MAREIELDIELKNALLRYSQSQLCGCFEVTIKINSIHRLIGGFEVKRGLSVLLRKIHRLIGGFEVNQAINQRKLKRQI